MADSNQVSRLIAELHAAKVINADMSVSDMMKASAASLGEITGSAKDSWYVVAGDHFVIICGRTNTEIAELGRRAQDVKANIGG
jgi:hypothetical protein